MKDVKKGRGRSFAICLLLLAVLTLTFTFTRCEDVFVHADGMVDDFIFPVDADLLAQESDPNYVPLDDEFLVEVAEELDAGVTIIGNIAAGAGSHDAPHVEVVPQEMLKVKSIPMTDVEQTIVSHEIDENKLHLTALSEKLDEEINQNAILEERLELCQATISACEGKLKEIDSLIETIPNCSPEIEQRHKEQISTMTQELQTLKHDLAVEQEKARFVERNAQQLDIKLKLAKNELNVAKISLDQQKLAMDSTVLQYEEKFTEMQKEVDRLNAMLIESRRSLKEVKHEVSQLKESSSTGPSWFSYILGTGGSINHESVEEKASETAPPATNSAQDESIHVADSNNETSKTQAPSKKSKVDESIVKLALRQGNKILKYAMGTIAWEYKITFSAISSLWRFSSHIWNEFLQPFLSFSYDTLRMNVVKDKAMEVYESSVKQKVQQARERIKEKYGEKLEDIYEDYFEWIVDFFVDKGHYLLYYGTMVLEGQESPMVFVTDAVSNMQNLVDFIANQDKIQNVLGSTWAKRIVATAFYGILTLLGVYLRERILGLALLGLVISILPFLLVIWAALKIFGLFYERKGFRSGRDRKQKRDRKRGEVREPMDAEPVQIRSSQATSRA